jgi:TPR repeat protein
MIYGALESQVELRSSDSTVDEQTKESYQGRPMHKNHLTALAIAAATALLVSSPAAQAAPGELERAQAAYFRGDYVEAMMRFQPLAEDGDAHATFLIGYMYEKGQGVPQDDEQAAEWYGRAAALGNPFAQNNLGVLYKYGRGVPKDLVQSYKWFDLAASGYLPAESGHKERAILNQQDIAAAMRLAEAFRDENDKGPRYVPPRVR